MLEIQKKAPSFTALNQDSQKVSLSAFKGKTVILYFYPKDDTSGCTAEGCDFRDHLSQFKKRGAVVLGVSRDPVDKHKKFATKYDFNFDLLADVEGKLTEDYGVWVQKSMYGRKYMGIERTTFIIGPDQKIKKIYSKVKVKGHVEQVLEDLKAIYCKV